MAETPVLELGRQSHSGLDRWGGKIQEEWLRDLRGIRGVRVYREMADNEPTIGGLFFAIRNLIRGLDWTMTMSEDDADLDERGVFIQECMRDMTTSWDDVIDEGLSFFEFGWAAQEIVWKMRRGPDAGDKSLMSQFTDGKIGWRSLPLIGQETLDQWQWDDDGDELISLTQYPDFTNPGTKGFSAVTVPRSKFILLRTTKRKDNPEGRSLLRNAYRPWFFKKNIEIFEAIGAERDLAGLPVLQVPAEILIPNPAAQFAGMRTAMQDLVSDLKRDELEGVLVPNEDAGYKLELLRGGGDKQFDTDIILKRKATEILISVLADFLMVGHGDTGSFALNISKVGMFTTAINAYVGAIEETIQAELVIPTLLINGMPIDDPPILRAGRVDVRDVTAVIESISKMAQAHLLPFDPQPGLANALLKQLGLPEIDEVAFEPPPPPVVGPAGVPAGEF